MARFIAVVASSIALASTSAVAQDRVVEESIDTETMTIRIVQVADGLEHPWSIAFLPDGAMLVTERPGRLQIIRNGEKTEVSGVPDIHAQNQGGLLDVAVHPSFRENQFIYLTYSKGDSDGTATTLARGRLVDDELRDVEDIFTQDRRSEPGRHYGSRLAFLPDGTLLMSIGDRGVEPERAQDPMDHAGTLLRLNDDGTVPRDNPFVEVGSFHPEIYSFGHRNIQALVVHPETTEVWAVDHGPRGGDRLDFIVRGGNYGWPTVSYGRDYETEEQFGEGRPPDAGPDALRADDVRPDQFRPAVREFLPTLAPSGMTVVTGDRYPRWRGHFLVSALAPEHVRRVRLEDGIVVHEEELIRGKVGRVRDLRMGPDGYIYLVTDERDGGVYRIKPQADDESS